MTPISCQSCGYANEPTRVFCHQCGVRLERPPAVVAAKPPKPVPVPKRKIPSPNDPKPGSVLFYILRTVVFSAFLAMIILALRTPQGFPTPASPNPALADALLLRYNEAIAPSSFPKTLVYTGEELNSLLATKVRVKQTGGATLGSGEPRPHLILQDHAFILVMEIPVAGMNVIFQNQFAVDNLTPGHLTVKTLGGKIGCLSLPPLIVEKLLRWPNALAGAFSEQLHEIQKANQVLIGPSNVQILWPADPQ